MDMFIFAIISLITIVSVHRAVLAAVRNFDGYGSIERTATPAAAHLYYSLLRS